MLRMSIGTSRATGDYDFFVTSLDGLRSEILEGAGFNLRFSRSTDDNRLGQIRFPTRRAALTST